VAAAATDYLTGLLNRRAFDVAFRHQCDRARRSGLPLALGKHRRGPPLSDGPRSHGRGTERAPARCRP